MTVFYIYIYISSNIYRVPNIYITHTYYIYVIHITYNYMHICITYMYITYEDAVP